MVYYFPYNNYAFSMIPLARRTKPDMLTQLLDSNRRLRGTCLLVTTTTLYGTDVYYVDYKQIYRVAIGALPPRLTPASPTYGL